MSTQYAEDEAGERRTLTEAEFAGVEDPPGERILASDNLTSQRPPGDFPVDYQGRTFRPGAGYWKTGTSRIPASIDGPACHSHRTEPRTKAS